MSTKDRHCSLLRKPPQDHLFAALQDGTTLPLLWGLHLIAHGCEINSFVSASSQSTEDEN